MDVPLSYPRNLGYLVQRLAGYHRNTFRIESTSTQTASAGSVITVNLPENAIIDLKSLRWVINSATTSYNGTQDIRGLLPFSQALIQRMEVYINGIQVTQGCLEYNTAFRLLRNARVPQSKSLSVDAALQNQNLDNSDTFAAGQTVQMVVQDWLGLFEAPSTRFLDTGLVGMITLRITLADNSILVPKKDSVPCSFGLVAGAVSGTTTIVAADATAAGNMTYSLSSYYFTIDSISLSDGSYDFLIRKKLARDGFLSVNYDEYYAFIQDGNSASSTQVRFAVASQSINKLYGTLRPTDYTSKGKPAAALPGTLVESFQPYFFNFKSGSAADGSFRWNYSVNNVYHPQYQASEIEALCQLVMTENKVGFDSPGNQITSIKEFKENKFCAAIRLNHPIDGEVRNAFISGFDSRGVNAQLVWNVSGVDVANGFSGQNYCAYVLVNTTNTLRFGLGRSLEVIF